MERRAAEAQSGRERLVREGAEFLVDAGGLDPLVAQQPEALAEREEALAVDPGPCGLRVEDRAGERHPAEARAAEQRARGAGLEAEREVPRPRCGRQAQERDDASLERAQREAVRPEDCGVLDDLVVHGLAAVPRGRLMRRARIQEPPQDLQQPLAVDRPRLAPDRAG